MAQASEQDTCSIDTTSSGGGGEKEGKNVGYSGVMGEKVMWDALVLKVLGVRSSHD